MWQPNWTPRITLSFWATTSQTPPHPQSFATLPLLQRRNSGPLETNSRWKLVCKKLASLIKELPFYCVSPYHRFWVPTVLSAIKGLCPVQRWNFVMIARSLSGCSFRVGISILFQHSIKRNTRNQYSSPQANGRNKPLMNRLVYRMSADTQHLRCLCHSIGPGFSWPLFHSQTSLNTEYFLCLL